MDGTSSWTSTAGPRGWSCRSWIEARGEPIRNPVSGETHRARINLPYGFEYDTAEIGRGWAETQGAAAAVAGRLHAQFAPLHITESGVVH